MFNDKQNQLLTYEIDSSRIRTRSKGNVTLSYLEGFDIIETANKIFGYGNWSYSITKLEQVSHELNANQNQVICYQAIVSVTIYNPQHTQTISKEDVGFGTGIAKTLADAHESGAKEAVTDALKRSFRSLGNQFGNSLYDKSRTHQAVPQQPAQIQQQQYNNAKSKNYQNNNALYQNSNIEDNIASMGLSLEPLPDGSVSVTGNSYPYAKELRKLGCQWNPTLKRWILPGQQAAA